jgi:hypothetical protein
MFNRKRPHGEVHGTGVAGAMFYQDGHYYDVDHEYVFSDPGMSAPRGVAEVKTMEQAQREVEERQAAIARGEKVPAKKPAAEPGAARSVPQVPQAPSGELTLQQRLMQLNVPKLQEMQYEALKQLNEDQPEDKRKPEKALRSEIIKGPGAKDKLVTWLVENSENE